MSIFSPHTKTAVLLNLLALTLAACAAPATPAAPQTATTTPQPAPPTAESPTLEPTTPPTEAPASTEPVSLPVENLGLTVAYIGADGNLWIADASGGPPRPLTSDAAPFESGGDVISYMFPDISSDGRFIAARRDAGIPAP